MIRLGVFLIIMGFGSLVLPLMHVQFRLMSLLDDAQPAAGIIVGGLGILFVVLGVRRNNAKKAQAPMMQAQMNYPNNLNMPPQQAAAMPAQVGNCQRCAQPIWAGEASCRSCGAPASIAPQR